MKNNQFQKLFDEKRKSKTQNCTCGKVKADTTRKKKNNMYWAGKQIIFMNLENHLEAQTKNENQHLTNVKIYT